MPLTYVNIKLPNTQEVIMKVVIDKLPRKSARIKFLGDIHVGSKKCDYKMFQETLDEIKNNDDCYCVVMGDLLNNSTRNSVGDVYEEPLTPMQQIEKAVSMLEPIKDKILGVTTGNHERRTYRTDGIDLMSIVCAQLGILDKYDPAGVLMIIKDETGRGSGHLYNTMYISHGDGANGKMIGGKANSLARRANNFANVDIVCVGHTHQPITFKQAYMMFDPHHDIVRHKEQLCINTSAFLDYEEYAEVIGLPPSAKAQPTLYLAADKEPQCLL